MADDEASKALLRGAKFARSLWINGADSYT